MRIIGKSTEKITNAAKHMADKYPDVLSDSYLFIVPFRPSFIRQIDEAILHGRLGAWGICITTFVPLMRLPVIGFNAELLDISLQAEYREHVNIKWFVDCDTAEKYIVYHEFAHAIYKNLPKEDKAYWEKLFIAYQDKLPSDYSKTNADECYAESLAAYIAGLPMYKDDILIKTAGTISLKARR